VLLDFLQPAAGRSKSIVGVNLGVFIADLHCRPEAGRLADKAGPRHTGTVKREGLKNKKGWDIKLFFFLDIQVLNLLGENRFCNKFFFSKFS
jgi:hypothetical protein